MFVEKSKKWDSLKLITKSTFPYPEHTGRFRSVYDIDAGEFDEITHNEYKHITLSNHQTNEATDIIKCSTLQEDDGFYIRYM